jgi:hypothetical protein
MNMFGVPKYTVNSWSDLQAPDMEVFEVEDDPYTWVPQVSGGGWARVEVKGAVGKGTIGISTEVLVWRAIVACGGVTHQPKWQF